MHERGLLERCREPASLLPVKVMTPTVLADRARRPVRPVTVAAPAAPQTNGAGHIEIDLPGDIRVRVHGRIEPRVLSLVLNALRNG